MTRAVIFDLDGTLIDSEPVYREVDARFLLEKGVLLSDDEWAHAVGMGGVPFMEYLRDTHDVSGDIDSLVAEKDDLYLATARDTVRPFARVLEFARLLYVQGVPLGIATSSRQRVLDAMLDSTGIGWLFRATVAGDEVRLPKPAPDAYLLAAERLGVPPESCLVLEDSEYGVRSAKAAGMRVVALPHPGTEDRPAFASADVVVNGGAVRVDVDQLSREIELEPTDDSAAIARLQEVVWNRYQNERREMPWRQTHDPYRILVSEFMLQQTQVSRVEPKYLQFVEDFPDVRSLARADLQDVLRHWQGLGYNRRGKNLHAAAKAIVGRHSGNVPDDLDLLAALPGVGPYTASAVMAFAFSARVTVVETNIRRLFMHFVFTGMTDVSDAQILEAVESAIDEPVRDWYYALMDYGAHLGRTLPNANRRSASYTRQSAFAGSIREMRGRILRELSIHGQMPEQELRTAVGILDSRFEKALEALIAEGMATIHDGMIRIP